MERSTIMSILCLPMLQSAQKLTNVCSCPMKTHHSSNAHICGLSKAVQNCIIYDYYLRQMRCVRTKISILLTPLTHDVTSASKLR